MGNLYQTGDHVLWVARLLPARSYAGVGLGAAAVSLGLFVSGALLAALAGLDYVDTPDVYLGVFAAFWMIVALGLADGAYLDVWNDARGAFAVDEATYRGVVEPHLATIHDTRRVLLVTAALWIPYMLLMAVTYLPDAPYHSVVVEQVFDGNQTYEPGLATLPLVGLYGAVNGVLIATILNGFVEHLALVEAVSDLPFRDVHTAATDLEPIAEFTVGSATMWFAGSSLIVIWMAVALSDAVGGLLLGFLAVTGLAFFIAPQLLLHDALVDAKRSTVADVQRAYCELHELVDARGASADDVSLELELLDRRLESARNIQTWVYDFTSVGKMAAAAVLPWLGLLQKLASTWNTVA